MLFHVVDHLIRSTGSDRLVLTGVPLDGGLQSADAFADTAARYAELGVTDLVVHWPRSTPPFEADVDVFERIFG